MRVRCDFLGYVFLRCGASRCGAVLLKGKSNGAVRFYLKAKPNGAVRCGKTAPNRAAPNEKNAPWKPWNLISRPGVLLGTLRV